MANNPPPEVVAAAKVGVEAAARLSKNEDFLWFLKRLSALRVEVVTKVTGPGTDSDIHALRGRLAMINEIVDLEHPERCPLLSSLSNLQNKALIAARKAYGEDA